MLTNTIKIVENPSLGGYTVIEMWNAEPVANLPDYLSAVEWASYMVLNSSRCHDESLADMEGFSGEGMSVMHDWAFNLRWDCKELAEEFTMVIGA